MVSGTVSALYTYSVQGPLRAQDGLTVYVVARTQAACGRAMAVTECLTRETAQKMVDEMNHVLAAQA
mgnify:CR=1 FL=1